MDNKTYACRECLHTQIKSEMIHEYGDGYDQYNCKSCGSVIIDDLHGVTYEYLTLSKNFQEHKTSNIGEITIKMELTLKFNIKDFNAIADYVKSMEKRHFIPENNLSPGFVAKGTKFEANLKI